MLVIHNIHSFIKLFTLKRSRLQVIFTLKHSRFYAETLPHSIYLYLPVCKEPVVRAQQLWISLKEKTKQHCFGIHFKTLSQIKEKQPCCF